ncbi:MAG: hypothetical protein VB024_00195 [Dysgonamonadaceae bacterium]|nr:hypothetical protein [Dysgonamonadaceae bacterium]
MLKIYNTVQEKKTVTADIGKKDDDGEPILRVKENAIIDKHYQPNTTAVIFALTNRDPDNWKNKMNNEMSLKSDLEKLSQDGSKIIAFSFTMTTL